jgi:hypothetical protein
MKIRSSSFVCTCTLSSMFVLDRTNGYDSGGAVAFDALWGQRGDA